MVVGLDVALALPTRDGLGQQLSAKREPACPMAVGEKAEVADAVEARGKDVQEEPAHELGWLERHDLAAALLPIVLPEEADGTVGHGDEPAVGDRNAMGVAAEIGQHLLGAAEGRFGVDHPVDPAQRRAIGGEGAGLGERSEVAEEAQPALGEGGGEPFEEERRNSRPSTLTDRKNPGGQAIQRRRSGERPPPGTMQWTCGW